MVFTMGLQSGSKHNPLGMIFQYPTSSALLEYATHHAVSSKVKPIDDIPASGSGVTQCFSRAQAKAAQDLYLGQIQLVDLSIHMPAALLQRALVSLNRIGTMDLTPYVFVSGSPLPEVMDAKTSGFQFPTLYYVTEASCQHCQSVDLAIHLWQLLGDAFTPGVDPHLPYVTVEPDKNVQINRVALYRHLAYITTLTPQQTVAYGMLKGLARKVSMAVPYDHATLREITGQAQLSTRLVDGRLEATFDIFLRGTLANLRSITDSAEDNAIIARQASEKLSQQCLSVLTLTQAQDVDPWGVGRVLDWQHPHEFARYSHWHQEYPKVVMVVHVHMTIHKLGDLK